MENSFEPSAVLKGYSDAIVAKGVGSSEYQVAALTVKISNLTEHLKKNKKDFSCKYGLSKSVAKRSKLLKYIKKRNSSDYQSLIKFLNLRK